MFLADQCQLRPFDASGFEKCFSGRRLFLIGAAAPSGSARPERSTLPAVCRALRLAGPAALAEWQLCCDLQASSPALLLGREDWGPASLHAM